ncbi:MAG: PP2C family protein-serine/threonine phosphatase [Pseudolysinimonas sp.]
MGARALGVELFARLGEDRFSELCVKTAGMLSVANSCVALVNDQSIWFRSSNGVTIGNVPREHPIWDVAMETHGTFVVDDLQSDSRFAAHPLVIGDVGVRFFASHVFAAQDGRRIGLFFVFQAAPLKFDEHARSSMAGMAEWIDQQLAAGEEYDRAAEVQRALHPTDSLPVDGYELAGMCVPTKAVGGDFFDWYPIDGGIAFTLGDVMGKGVGAAIIAATVRAVLRSARRNKSVVAAVERAEDCLVGELSAAGAFVTLFHARLRASDGRISFVDAGHGLTVIVNADGTTERLATTDFPLGTALDDGWRRQRVILKPGSTMVTFSDGVLDLYDGTLDSVDRVAEIARGASSAKQIVDEIERLARRDGAPDDVTVLAIRRAL